MPKLFISHGSKDKPIARRLQQALEDRGLPTWIDERELRGGDDLPDALKRNIEDARAFLLLVSPAAFESEWVSAELDLALEVRRTKPAYRIIALSLDGTRLGAFKRRLGRDPLYLELASTPNGTTEVMPDLLAALGEVSPMAQEPPSQSRAGPDAQPLEDLVLTLTDLCMHQDRETGARRARAKASLAYKPAEQGATKVNSRQAWLLTAPIGPIEAGELAWYLEKWPIWPSTSYQDRAQQVERDLIEWGKLLYQAALPPGSTANVLAAWQGVDAWAARRFSVEVDATPLDGASDEERRQTHEAATALLGLPWELLHDGDRFLFQGARPTRVRRRLPSERHYSRPLLADHRIPLVFLEACQTAQAEDATDSVATALLKVGVAGVAAMSHSVLVETAKRFVRPFYRVLAEGRRIGEAMLAAQQALFDDCARGQVFGAGRLELHDWFVPVLYQEQDDPRLFSRIPAPSTREQLQIEQKERLGALPRPPDTGFIGRSRELLALERQLRGPSCEQSHPCKRRAGP